MSKDSESKSYSWDDLSELYARAAGLDEAGRRELLDRACAGRDGMRVEIEAMLAVADTGHALELEGLADAGAPEATPPGTVVGAYRLLRLIAHGGMGEVHLAERVDGEFEQRVAVKLLRTGWPPQDLLERFRLEREVLARLTHPAIVPLLDGGTSDDGRPYLVLQFVEGLPITEHCARARLDLRARMRLFVTLCRVVQYAHSNLVVHRDLKPSNILVTAEGEIRLLDFGVAKLLQPDEESSELTRATPAPMTPGRAAPEQRRGERVSTATDVWALGVLLHELVAGEAPEDLESDPVRISPRLAVRDLAAVTAVALRADPDRRYGSAGQMGDDVERWLAGEPVSARPDALGYRLLRFVGRHRAAVAGAAAAFLALLALAAVSTLQSVRIARERSRATAEARKAEAVVDLLVEIFGGVDPMEGASGDTVRIADLLARGEERVDALGDQPEIQASVRHTLGKILLERGSYSRAVTILGEAREAEIPRLGADNPELAVLRLDYARALHMTGKMQVALSELRAVHESLASSPERRPALEARALRELGSLEGGAEGERRVEESIALERQLRPPDSLALGSSLVALAMMRRSRGDLTAARPLFQEALDLERPVLGADHLDILSLRSNLAGTIADPHARAAEHRSILAARIRRLGEDHPYVANSWNYLGAALEECGQYEEADRAFRRAWEIWVEHVGPSTGQALFALHHRARIAGLRGDREGALALYDRLVAALPDSRIDSGTAASYRAEAAAFRSRVAGPDRRPGG